MLFVQLTPTRDSTSELLDALQHREVDVFGHNTPGKTRTPKEKEHRSGTFFSGKWKSRTVEQKEQHSTSSTSQTPSAPRHPEIFYMLETLESLKR